MKEPKIYGNHTYDDGVERYCGYTIEEATRAAVGSGRLYAWEWLQAWWNAELEPDAFTLEDWSI